MFEIKKEINVKSENLKQYQLFKSNPLYLKPHLKVARLYGN